MLALRRKTVRLPSTHLRGHSWSSWRPAGPGSFQTPVCPVVNKDLFTKCSQILTILPYWQIRLFQLLTQQRPTMLDIRIFSASRIQTLLLFKKSIWNIVVYTIPVCHGDSYFGLLDQVGFFYNNTGRYLLLYKTWTYLPKFSYPTTEPANY